MTVINSYLVKIAEEAVGNLDRYANKDGYDEGFIETYYWCKKGFSRQFFNSFPGELKCMDWGSWLKVTNKEQLLGVLEHWGITKLTYCLDRRDEDGNLIWDGDQVVNDPYEIPVTELPDDGLYGSFDVEMC